MPGASYVFYAYVATMDGWKSDASKPYPFTAPAKYVGAAIKVPGLPLFWLRPQGALPAVVSIPHCLLPFAPVVQPPRPALDCWRLQRRQHNDRRCGPPDQYGRLRSELL